MPDLKMEICRLRAGRKWIEWASSLWTCFSLQYILIVEWLFTLLSECNVSYVYHVCINMMKKLSRCPLIRPSCSASLWLSLGLRFCIVLTSHRVVRLPCLVGQPHDRTLMLLYGQRGKGNISLTTNFISLCFWQEKLKGSEAEQESSLYLRLRTSFLIVGVRVACRLWGVWPVALDKSETKSCC